SSFSMPLVWIRSKCIEDLHRSVQKQHWASTRERNDRLAAMYSNGEKVYLAATWWDHNEPTGKLFGIARMCSMPTTSYDLEWKETSKWGTVFLVEWIVTFEQSCAPNVPDQRLDGTPLAITDAKR